LKPSSQASTLGFAPRRSEAGVESTCGTGRWTSCSPGYWCRLQPRTCLRCTRTSFVTSCPVTILLLDTAHSTLFRLRSGVPFERKVKVRQLDRVLDQVTPLTAE
jgi:hypothetical protein